MLPTQGQGGGVYCQVTPPPLVTGKDTSQWAPVKGTLTPRPLELPAVPQHPLADVLKAPAWADGASCAGAELDLAVAPIASGSLITVGPLAHRGAFPPLPSRVPRAPYAPQWRSCGLASPPAPPRPRPLALVPLRPLLHSFPRDCTPSTESVVASTLTSRTRSRLPLSSSTGVFWAWGRRGAVRESFEHRGRSNLQKREEENG